MKTIFPAGTRVVSNKSLFLSELSTYLFHTSPLAQVIDILPACALVVYLIKDKLHLHALRPTADMIMIPTSTVTPIRVASRIKYRRINLAFAVARAEKRMEDHDDHARAAYWVPGPEERERMQLSGRAGYIQLQEFRASKALARQDHLLEIIQAMSDLHLAVRLPSVIQDIKGG